MKWVGLQMMYLGSLLFLDEQISGTIAARYSRCVSVEALNDRGGKFWRPHWNTPKNLLSVQPTRTCTQVAKEMCGEVNNRALSPWKYSINRDDSRFPRDIAVAECLCEGCIINRVERHDYNSVPVLAPLMVLTKTPCPHDRDKYVLKRVVIRIAVACTCVVPK